MAAFILFKIVSRIYLMIKLNILYFLHNLGGCSNE